MLHYAAAVVDYLHGPVEFEGRLLFVAELPVDITSGAHTFGKAEEREGGADRDVETFGEAVHWYFDVAVGVVDSLLCEAGEFGAENEGYGLRDVEVGDHGVVLVRQGGDDAVASGVQFVVGLQDVGVLVVVYPLVRPH